MAQKVKATKTINPLHFEDLEPHRFEDLVRRLLYGFKEWGNIEATGRAGSDEGFDVRAWEKDDVVTNVNEEGEEGTRHLEGRLWQVQGKREKTISPGKIRTIIREGVDQAQPPYGYILAAATNISKAAYDAFREELRKRGVNEFYFWGKDYLEDQLSLPHNDEILFTFFGLSLSPRRRSKIAETKFVINNKNKLLKLIFGNESLIGQGVPRNKTFLLRDIKADQYPYVTAYDFQKQRRWEEHDAVEISPRGIMFKIRERFAYLDRQKKEWDFSPAVDLTLRKHNIDKSNEARLEDAGKRAERFWRHLPQRVQAKLIVYGFVRFEDVLIIDDKGDTEYNDPHLFIDFTAHGPFHGTMANLIHDRKAIGQTEFEQFSRISVFPASFPEPEPANVFEVSDLNLDAERAKRLRYSGHNTFYSFEGKLKQLSVGSVIHVPAIDRNSESYAEVTYIESTTVAEFLKHHEDSGYYRTQLEQDAGRKITNQERLEIYEVHAVSFFDGKLFSYLDTGW